MGLRLAGTLALPTFRGMIWEGERSREQQFPAWGEPSRGELMRSHAGAWEREDLDPCSGGGEV